MNHWPILQGLILVLVANGTPVLATMGLAAIDVLMATMLFWVGGILLSRLLFALGIRDRPY